MLHVGKALFLYGEEQTISDNVTKKLKEYFDRQGELYVRYGSILNMATYILNERGDNSDDFRWELRRAAVGICAMLDEVYKKKGVKIYKQGEFLEILHEYINKFKNPDFLENINHINDTIKNNRELYSKKVKYSFHEGVKIFKKDKIQPQDAVKSIISMLYARDYYNIDSILIMRNYLISSEIANYHLEICALTKKPGNDLLGLFFSDYTLIDRIYDLYNYFFNTPQSLMADIPLAENNELIKDNFDFICMIVYARYIISIFIFIIECDKTGYFENEKIDKILLKAYRTFSLIILSSVYRNLSMFEFTWFSNMELLNDICVYAYEISPRDRLDEARTMASAISADAAHKDFTKIIEKIVKAAIKKWKDGCDFNHIQMIDYYKKSNSYAEFFNERGFERNLKKSLIEAAKQEGINKISGVNYFQKGPRSRKKKDDA